LDGGAYDFGVNETGTILSILSVNCSMDTSFVSVGKVVAARNVSACEADLVDSALVGAG
jgi:hypothetical protein